MWNKLIGAVLFFLLLAAGIALSLPLWARPLIEWGLEKAIPDSRVTVKSVGFEGWRAVNVLETAIVHPQVDIKVEKITLDTRLNAVVKGAQIGTKNYGRFKITDIQAGFQILRDSIKTSFLRGNLETGTFEGEAVALFKPGLSYSVNLTLHGLDTAVLIQRFELEKKIDVASLLSGRVSFEGNASKVTLLKGDFSPSSSGGDITIRDKSFLETIAKNTRQPIHLVEAGFKEYHFETGVLKWTLEENDAAFSVHLDGPKGKRDVQITFHDIF